MMTRIKHMLGQANVLTAGVYTLVYQVVMSLRSTIDQVELSGANDV